MNCKEKYNEIWDKVSNTIKKGSDTKLLYNEKCLKNIKRNLMKEKFNTNVYNVKIPKKFLIIFVYQ